MIKLWQFIIRVLYKTRILSFVNFSIPLKFYDSKVNIPIRGYLGLYNVFMDEFWISDIYNIIKDDCKMCVDVGANVGQTLIKWKSINPAVKYLGLEPNTSCCYYLHELIKSNRYTDCNIIPAGINFKNDVSEIYFLWDELADRSATQYPSNKDSVLYSQLVNFIAWEQLGLSDALGLHLIKIDVEKAEAIILSQICSSVLDCIIIVEILPLSENEDNSRIKSCLESVVNSAYSIYRVNKNKEKLDSLTLMDTFSSEGKVSESDYLLLKESHKKYFMKWINNNE